MPATDDIVKNKIAAIRDSAGRIVAGGDEEDIHRFRVGYKKLRAFIRLLRASGQADKALLTPLKEIYQAAGTVRDLQLYRRFAAEKLEEAGITKPVYVNLLQQRADSAESSLRELLGRFSFDYLTKHITKNIHGQLGDSKVTQYVKEQARAAAAAIRAGSTDTNIHTARKHLKDVLYNIGYLRKGGDNDPEQLQKELKTLTDMMGGHNDSRTALGHLATVQDEDIPPAEKMALAKAVKELQVQKRKQKRELLRQFAGFRKRYVPGSMAGVALTGVLGSLLGFSVAYFLGRRRR